MSQKTSILTLSILAAAALTRERFVNAAGAVATAAGSAVGVTDTDADINTLVPVTALGTAIITAGGPIAKDSGVEVGADGKGVVLDAGVKVAKALQAALADGDRIEVLLIPN